MQNISAQQIDILNEIGNIGAGNAATALSQLMGTMVDMSLPWTKLCLIEEGCELLSRPDEAGVGIQIALEGKINGLTLLTFDEESALYILNAFGDMLPDKRLESDMARSALMEVGNIVTGSFATAISEFLKTTAWCTPPLLIHDYFDAFVCSVVVSGCQETDHVLVFKTELFVGGKALQSDLAFMPTKESFQLIMRELDATRG
ncbi:MAG: chemotaxis protein CheC [Firmicutes bacterium]|nr:chemotaxis protein CheC [Dethiobacter sp.]MBS3888663.1 chemotaxis protein CheC [Bacillota bacterium]MBS4053313.1 chemotaxis protein CheC [Thermaerobacter sp.]